MKKLLALVLVVAAGIMAYNYFMNAPAASADERSLADLEHQFDSANQSMMQASRAAGGSGLDTTADFEAARAAVRRVEAQLQQVKPRLQSDAARQRVEGLEEKIRAFKSATD